MKTNLSTFISLCLIALVFLVCIFLSNQYMRGFNVDLTEDKLYSLSDGTHNILRELESPIELHFFFSDSTTKGMAQLRNYAMQVESLLIKYAELGGDNVRLTIIDPKPFSEQEDKAAAFGLTSAGASPTQDSLYFGLVGENSQGDAMVIGFFDPSKSAFLEYDISKLIYQLSSPEAVRVTIVTDIPIMGEQNPMTGQALAPSVIYQQLAQLFDVEVISSSAQSLPIDTDVLLVAHAQGTNEALLYAIDQYMMAGGKTIIFHDPHFESDTMAMFGAVGANSSELPLLQAYGIDLSAQYVVLDALTALEIRGPQGGVLQHFGFLGLGTQEINRIDVTSGDLESINGASFGSIELQGASSLRLTPLLQSSNNTALLASENYAQIEDPGLLTQGFNSSGKVKNLAARISGTVQSYFSRDSEVANDAHISQTGSLNIVVVADADLLMDRFWVQQSNFFGQTMFTPFADNGDFVINIVENYGGSENLIGLRGRGTLSRPFTRVDDIATKAQTKFREQENLLQMELQETEMQLSQLQGQQGETLAITDEQQQAIDSFIAKRIDIRKALRDVQFQLDKDINALGNTLKLLNIVVAPIVLTFILYLLSTFMRRRA